MSLSWPHLGLDLEISRLEISTRKLVLTLSWPHLGLHLAQESFLGPHLDFFEISWPHPGLHLEISGLGVSPRGLSYLGHILG